MIIKPLLNKLCAAAVMIVAVAVSPSCDSVDDNRLPYAEVHLTFHTVGDWNIYGVKEDAAGYQRYIFNGKEKVPSDFPYTQLDRTGFGGLLLVTDVLGDLHAYDLACPYDRQPDIRVAVPDGMSYARCQKCGSTFDIYMNHGNPLSGPAAEKGYALQQYHVYSGGPTEYRVITR